MKKITKMKLKKIGVYILTLLIYMISSLFFALVTGYGLGYLFFLLYFFVAKRICNNIERKTYEQMTEDEIKAEEEKSDLGVFIFGIIISIAILAFLAYCLNNL